MINVNDAGFKFYLNSFPKAGLHLLDLLVMPLASPMPADEFDAPWAGMFKGNSFSIQPKAIQQITWKIGRTQPRSFTKGHLGHNQEIEFFLYYLGITHILAYRDFRDVAVSLTYHILSDKKVTDVETGKEKDLLPHQGKEDFRRLGGFDEILEAVIVGHDVFPGVMERWEGYAGWFNIPWVLRLSFEDMRSNPGKCARAIIQFTFDRYAHIVDMGTKLNEDAVGTMAQTMADSSQRTNISPTFRKGNIGDWRTHFKPHHIKLMKETDRNDWLVTLGYEKSPDWT